MAYSLDDLSKRELFAAFALMGSTSQQNWKPWECAERAVSAADALIGQLRKRSEGQSQAPELPTV